MLQIILCFQFVLCKQWDKIWPNVTVWAIFSRDNISQVKEAKMRQRFFLLPQIVLF